MEINVNEVRIIQWWVSASMCVSSVDDKIRDVAFLVSVVNVVMSVNSQHLEQRCWYCRRWLITPAAFNNTYNKSTDNQEYDDDINNSDNQDEDDDVNNTDNQDDDDIGNP